MTRTYHRLDAEIQDWDGEMIPVAVDVEIDTRLSYRGVPYVSHASIRCPDTGHDLTGLIGAACEARILARIGEEIAEETDQ